jgi:hypothetical protein
LEQVQEDAFVRNGIDVRLVARRQRLMLWLVLGSVASFALPFLADPVFHAFGQSEFLAAAFFLFLIAIRLAVIVGAVLVMRALRTNIVVLVLCALLMFLPAINLLILLVENLRATRVLRRAGLRVGFMGVMDDDVVRTLAPNLCRRCGYDLRGNVSGRCPECGTNVPATVAQPAAG